MAIKIIKLTRGNVMKLNDYMKNYSKLKNLKENDKIKKANSNTYNKEQWKVRKEIKNRRDKKVGKDDKDRKYYIDDINRFRLRSLYNRFKSFNRISYFVFLSLVLIVFSFSLITAIRLNKSNSTSKNINSGDNSNLVGKDLVATKASLNENCNDESKGNINGNSDCDKLENVEEKENIPTEKSLYVHTDDEYDVDEIKAWVYGDKEPPKKMVFITVDDGPSTNNTPKVLDVLKSYGIHGTFFYVTSYDFDDADEVVKRTLKEGHSIGIHSNNHIYSLLYPDGVADSDYITLDIERAIEKIRAVDKGFKTELYRYPGGSFSWENTDSTTEILKEKGLKPVDWNIMTGDADSNLEDRTPQGIIEYMDVIFQNTPEKDREVLVLLMHDPSFMDITPKALPSVIEYFLDKGYSFGKIKQCT